VAQFVDELSKLDSNSPEFGKKVDQLTAMGRKEISEAAGASNRFLDRPVKAFHNEMLRWYDQWLKGIDTGILRDPPVRFWVMGANEWRSGSDWPLPETQWVKFYLRGWERLTTEPFVAESLSSSSRAFFGPSL